MDNIPSIYIEANEDSLYLNKKINKKELTCIEFPTYSNWNILIANICKYSLYVCLVKD